MSYGGSELITYAFTCDLYKMNDFMHMGAGLSTWDFSRYPLHQRRVTRLRSVALGARARHATPLSVTEKEGVFMQNSKTLCIIHNSDSFNN